MDPKGVENVKITCEHFSLYMVYLINLKLCKILQCHLQMCIICRCVCCRDGRIQLFSFKFYRSERGGGCSIACEVLSYICFEILYRTSLLMITLLWTRDFVFFYIMQWIIFTSKVERLICYIIQNNEWCCCL
jgi:hypothetical protein